MTEEKNIVKISGGLAVMFSVFLLLFVVKQVSEQNALSTRVTPEITTPTSKTEKTALTQNENVQKGAFNIQTKSNLIRSYGENSQTLFHYKTLVSEKLKNENIKPALKLEVVENGKNMWKEKQWSWIDYDQGILYFHFKTVENEKEEMIENYTGNYQLLFD